MKFAVSSAPLDAAAMAAAARDRAHGAVVVFEGVVRDMSDDGRAVTGLSYEAHETMALAEFAKIDVEARNAFGNVVLSIAHRTGDLGIGETAVVVVAAAAHRAAAFDACRYAIDELKARAPIWKRERFASGEAQWRSN